MKKMKRVVSSDEILMQLANRSLTFHNLQQWWNNYYRPPYFVTITSRIWDPRKQITVE